MSDSSNGSKGANPSGKLRGLNPRGSCAGRKMLNRKEKPPAAVNIPTSPMWRPFRRYCLGSVVFAPGIQRGQPLFFDKRC